MARKKQISRSSQETESIGSKCAALLEPGDVVLVRGDLGSGKTTFIKGACAALKIKERVTSPSYVIGQVYAGDPPVAHVDLYRLEGRKGEDPALLSDYLTAERIAFIEWPKQDFDFERKPRLVVEISHQAEGTREIEIVGEGPLP